MTNEVKGGGGRVFDTGATRDTDEAKYDYEGFLCPYVMEEFGAYMHGKRKMQDGTTRSSDNWQKGIPTDVYVKSLFRHFHAIWIAHREGNWNRDDCMGMLFNLQGFIHEHLKAERADMSEEALSGGRFSVSEPPSNLDTLVEGPEGGLQQQDPAPAGVAPDDPDLGDPGLPVAPWEKPSTIEDWRKLYQGTYAQFGVTPEVLNKEKVEAEWAKMDHAKNYSEITKGYNLEPEQVSPEAFDAQVEENKRIDDLIQKAENERSVAWLAGECDFAEVERIWEAKVQAEWDKRTKAEYPECDFTYPLQEAAAASLAKNLAKPNEILDTMRQAEHDKGISSHEWERRNCAEALERLNEAATEHQSAADDYQAAQQRVLNPRQYLDPTTAKVYGDTDQGC